VCHGPFVILIQATDDIQQGTFTTTGFTENRTEFTTIEAGIDIMQDLNTLACLFVTLVNMSE